MTMPLATSSASPLPAACRGAYRLEITCPIIFRGPLHVGTGERLSVVSDAPILRDAAGAPYLPPSSVRGVLRDWCEREAPLLGVEPVYVRRLFGATPRAAEPTAARDPQRQDDRQGRLTVSSVALASGSRSEVRDHVRIDRRWGAAAAGGKFDQEIIHCASATIRLVYEGDAPDDPEILLLRSAVAALEVGLLAFGGKTGWGFGWAAAPERGQPTEYRGLDRSHANGLAAYLADRLGGAQPSGTKPAQPPERRPRSAVAGEPRPWSWLQLDVELQFDGPMLVAGRDRQEPTAGQRQPDAAYLQTVDDEVVLPGSSWRGAVHAHADRVATTLGCATIVETLFGTVKRGDRRGRQGLLRVGEGRLVDRHGNPLDSGQAPTVWMDHVAIDRITGFSAEKKLFNCRALASPRFRVPMLVRWHAGDAPTSAAAALLLFALRDAAAGLLWVGSRTTRGYGHLAALRLAGGRLCAVADGRRPEPIDIPPDAAIGALGDHQPIATLLRTWNAPADAGGSLPEGRS